MPSAPPLPPSPLTMTTIGVSSIIMSRRLTAIAVDLDEIREQPVDEIFEVGPARMARDEHPLPRRQRAIELGADRLDAPPQHLDLTIARVGARLERQRLDLLQENGDRLLEFEVLQSHLQQVSPRKHETAKTPFDELRASACGERVEPWFRAVVVSWPIVVAVHRSSTDPAPTTCSSSAIRFGDGRTRICELTSTLTRSRFGGSPVSTSNDTLRSPRWREKISPSVSSVFRSAGLRRWIATSRARRSRTLSIGVISDARMRTVSSSRSSFPRTRTIVPVSIKPALR